MQIMVALLGLGLLIFLAYRGFSVILFAPVAAMVPVLLTYPTHVPEIFTSLYLEKMVYFVKLYFPLFLLGAVFGKLMELSGFAKSLVTSLAKWAGPKHAMLAIVLISALLTYGGVSLFVVVFAVYPIAAELFRQADVPKRLLPAALALGAFSFTMDALPGTPQIQNIIPTAFFGTTAWAAPVLGCSGAVFIFVGGMAYLQWKLKRVRARGEGYGTNHLNEPGFVAGSTLTHPAIAILPLIIVPFINWVFSRFISVPAGATSTVVMPGLTTPLVTNISAVRSIWALEGALLLAIVLVVIFGFRQLRRTIAAGSQHAVTGALLATMNTASEFGFGAVISALPGFLAFRDAIGVIPNPLLNAAITTTSLAGMTGSASGGLSISLAAMSAHFTELANASGISLAVMHRVTAMASGGMDLLPHNGAIITALTVTGLTHRQSYPDIFAITLIKTAAVFFVILVYKITGLN
jgi:H+/gluconate symporter-like permease